MFRTYKIYKATTNLPSCSTGRSDGHSHRGTHCLVHSIGVFTLEQLMVHADPHRLNTRLLGHEGRGVVVPTNIYVTKHEACHDTNNI